MVAGRTRIAGLLYCRRQGRAALLAVQVRALRGG